jgi:hypothetical protein
MVRVIYELFCLWLARASSEAHNSGGSKIITPQICAGDLNRSNQRNTLRHANRNHGLDNPECAMLRQKEDWYAGFLVVLRKKKC